MPTFFTADTHFGHKNIIQYSNRPFSSVEEMDETLVTNWCKRISEKDVVYHLGDFTLKGIDYFYYISQQLSGKIFIVPGSHDAAWIKKFKDTDRIKLLPPLVTIKVPQTNSDSQLVVLCHYSMRVWDRSHYGTWHLYGHSHGNLPNFPNSMDVGVDSHSFSPVSFDEIKKVFNRG